MNLEPSQLPDLNELRRRSQALAMLDAIICPEWESRYYSFNTAWSKAEAMGSMRNGCGDHWFILFGEFGAAIKGLARETAIAEDTRLAVAVQTQVPLTFSPFLTEPAFSMDRLSYCYWRSSLDIQWHKARHPHWAHPEAQDGSLEFLAVLCDPATSYKEFAEWYYELKLPLTIIECLYQHTPLTEHIVRSLNPDLSLMQTLDDAMEIGYPVCQSHPPSSSS